MDVQSNAETNPHSGVTAENQAWWDIHKPEVYGITGYMIAESLKHSLSYREAHPPLGLPQSDNNEPLSIDDLVHSPDPYLEMREKMNVVLQKGLNDYINFTSQLEQSNPDKKALDRLETLLFETMKRSIRPITTAISSDIFISQGISGATDVISNVFKIIPQAYQKKFPEQNITDKNLYTIAKNSYPLIAMFAGSQIFSFNSSRKELKNNPHLFHDIPYDPDYFVLEGTADRTRLVLRPDMFKYLQQKYGLKLREHPDFTEEVLTCPAFQQQSIPKIFDWMLDITKYIYKAKFPPSPTIEEE